MKPEISEFSYGYALTNELVDRYGLSSSGAPYFPNQFQEGQSGGGFDMQLPGVPFFFQFKASDKLIKRNAMESSQLGVPYYRFEVKSSLSSLQHSLLRALELKYKYVYYAAPIFSSCVNLNRYYSSKSIAKNSIFLSPKKLGKLDDGEPHTVSFTNTDPVVVRSEPVYVKRETILYAEELFDLKQIPDITVGNLVNQLVGLYNQNVESSYRVSQQEFEEGEEDRPIRAVMNLSRNLFGAELLFING